MRAHSSSNSAAVVRWLRLKIAATAPTADIEWWWWWWWCGGGQHTEERTTTAPLPQQRCSLCCTAVVWRKAAAVELSRFWVAWWRPSTAPQQHHSTTATCLQCGQQQHSWAPQQMTRYPRLSSAVSRGLLPFYMFGSNILHVVQDRYKWETTTLFGESSKDISPR